MLILPSWYPSGPEDSNGSFFREQAEALARSGMRVGVAAVEGISLHDRRARSKSIYGRAVETLENGVPVFRASALRPAPLMQRLNVGVVVAKWRQVFAEYVKRHGIPDVLHAHTLNPAGIAARAISEEAGIPFVITEHRPDSAPRDARRRSMRRVLKVTLKRADSLIAVSPAFAEVLNQAYGVEGWNYIPNLLPPQFEDAPVRVPAEPPFVFGHVSNLNPYKCVDLLLEAFHRAFGEDETVLLRIAGDSEYRVGLEAHARTIGLQNVEFVGNVGRSHIVQEFSKFHVFVLPSEAESFGVVFWEAMACGQPIIATNTDGGRLAVSEESGYLTQVGDIDALSHALVKMRKNIDLFDRDVIRARSIKECGYKVFVKRYLEVYESAAS